MDTLLGRYRNLIVLAAILFAQIIGLALQVRRPTPTGEVRLLRLWAVSAVTPFEKAAIHTQTWAGDKWRNYLYLRGVRRENRELRAELDRMKIEQARLSEDAHMAQRVQALLAFKEQYIESTVAAQVIGTSGSEQSRILYIDKGSEQGLKSDMAVITPTGIVGKIVQVFPGSAQVLPINDQFSGVGVALKDSRLQGILKGSPNGATTLQYIMSDETVKPGEEVITSGGDRIFPKGLPVGQVVSVQPGKDLFLNIRVIPAAHLDRLEEVLVVTKVTEREPDTKDLGPIRAADILAERLPTVPQKPAPAIPGAANSTGAAPGPSQAATAPAGTPTGPQSKPTAGVAAGQPRTVNGVAAGGKPITGVTSNQSHAAGGATSSPTAAPSNGSATKPPPSSTATNSVAKPSRPLPGNTAPSGEAAAAPQQKPPGANGAAVAKQPKPKPSVETGPANHPAQNAAPPAQPPAEPPQ